MPFDGLAAFAAVKEFQDALTMGKIDKIYQPQREQLLLIIHTRKGNRKLFISSASNHSAMYFVDKTPENPANPPLFCMVLRKHISAARITQIIQHENDRIIEILLETVNELGFSVNKKLIVEIMGKHSNIILVDMETGRIIDSIKHVSIDVNRARQILPGKVYTYPPAQEKIPFEQLSKETMERLTEGQLQPARSILSGVQGISPVLAETLVSSPQCPYETLHDIIESIESGTSSPLVYLDEEGKPADFHITPLETYKGYAAKSFASFSNAAAYYFQNRESTNTVKQRSNDLLRVIKNHLDKLNLKTQRLNEDLFNAENSEKYRLYGELLTSNLHMAKAGSSSVTVTNYYDNSQLEIPLDPRLTTSKNAQNYYKKYGKSKTAVKEKKIQLEDVSREIAYLESVAEFAARAASLEELENIKQELTDSGYIRFKKKKNAPKRKEQPKPFSYTLSSGLTVLAGKNNKENDWLTLKKAGNNDIWFHTKDIPGSHLILLTQGNQITDLDLAQAASIAAYHSKGRDSENVPVDYTKVRYVKKPAGAKPGMVIFTHNKTLYVTPRIPEQK